jgi:hypothetical protein
MTDDSPDETCDLPDDYGVRGKAAAHTGSDGERTPGIIVGSRREPEEQARVLLDLKDEDQLLDTNRARVEVLS